MAELENIYFGESVELPFESFEERIGKYDERRWSKT